jgi:hypothetical protein
LPLYRERFCIAFPTGHRLEQQNRVRISDVAGETYLRRINCEYRDCLAERLREQGLATRVGFQSEREDWIQMMVAAGFGVCFLPEFSPTIPGVRTQPVSEPEVVRVVSLVSMAGRRFSPAVLAFIRAIRITGRGPGRTTRLRARRYRLSREALYEIGRRDDRDLLEWVEREQIGVAGNAQISMAVYRQFQEFVVLRITARGDPLNDPYQFGCPRRVRSANPEGSAGSAVQDAAEPM